MPGARRTDTRSRIVEVALELFAEGDLDGTSLLEPNGSLTANLLATIVSTVLDTELHRRVTFRGGARVPWVTAQWQSGGLAAVGLLATSIVLGAVELLNPGTAWWTQILLVTGSTLLIGLVRYLALRGWVFDRTHG